MFLESVANACALGPQEEALPWVEAPRLIIEYINRGRLAGFDSVGYCIFNGCKVYEEGKRQAAIDKEKLTTEEMLFGKKK